MADLDYGTLAQLTQPRMMENAPMGAGAMAGMMYGQDRNRHEQALEGASAMAMLKAKMDAMKAEEYARGAPGRNATIDVGNAMAQGQLTGLPTNLDTQDTEFKSKNLDARNKLQGEIRQALGNYASRWVSATDDEKQNLLDEIEADGNGEFNGKKLRSMPKPLLDKLMADIDKTHPSPQVGKERIAQMGVDKAKYTADTAAAARVKAAEIAANIQKMIADKKIAHMIPEPNRVIFEEIRAKLGLDAAAQWYNDTQLAKESARAGNARQNIDINPSDPDNPVTPRPIERPKSVPLPAGMNRGTGPTKVPPGAIIQKQRADGTWIFKTNNGIVDENGKPTKE